MVDKRSRIIFRSTKDTEVKSLESLGVKSKRIIKHKCFFMWHILLPTPEDWIKTASWELLTKDLIIRIEYEGRQRPKVAIFEIPPICHIYLIQLVIVWTRDGDYARSGSFPLHPQLPWCDEFKNTGQSDLPKTNVVKVYLPVQRRRSLEIKPQPNVTPLWPSLLFPPRL